MGFFRLDWIVVYLYGVLGVECSNHSVPTIFFNDFRPMFTALAFFMCVTFA